LSIVTDKDGNIDFITAYALKDKSQLRSEIKKGIKVEVRRGLARTFDPHSRVQVPSATDEIISQKGNLVNEKEANGLRDSVSSIGDNASRAGGRQAGDEQILRQGRRDTTNASQTKRPAQSDEQMEQQWAAKADGQTNAAVAGKQVVEKQGSSASVGGGVAANSSAHLGSGMVAGTLNSVDEDGNFSPERFAAGFLAGLVGSKATAVGLRKMTPKLYNQILGAAEKMPQMANSNPRLLGKLYSNGKDVSLNSFAGEKAITANVGKLDQAKAMLEKGTDEAEIWQKTGWFKDKDGAWKFEIGDSNAKLNLGFQSRGRLGELLDHEELFKAYPELKDVTVVKIGGATPQDAAYSVKDVAQKEKRGIYNVTYNDKTATLVRQDLQKIDDALVLEKGSNKKGGAVHIKKHLDPGAQGAITQGEFLSVGKNIREYLQKYKKPFIDESGGRIYEWADGNGVKFRVVVYEKADGISASHPNSIISFYSNRNLKKPMEFRNPQVKYDVNLKEWHKDSSAITKNADGSPKVFYHGSSAKDITGFKSEFDNSGVGFWFADKDYAANHGEGNLYETFLRIKNPLDLREENAKYPFELMREMQRKGLSLEPYGKTSKEAKEFLKQNGYDGIVLDGDYKERPFVIAFDSAQIKHVDNNGNFNDSPNIYKSGAEGYYDPARNEIGLSDLGDKSTLIHEVQHTIQEIEDFARGGNFNTVWNVAAKNIEKKYESELARLEKISNDAWQKYAPLQKEYIKLFDDGLKDTPEAQRLLKQMRAFGDEGSRADHEIRELRQAANAEQNAINEEDLQEIYRKMHGEAEARNVQNRLNLDGQTHPHKTFDVNPNETIASKEDGISYSRRIEEIKRTHPNVERELDESIAAMRKESFNDSNFKDGLISKFDTKEITTQELGKSVNLSDKQLAVLKNDIKNADFKVISDSKIYFDKIGKDGDKKRFFVDIAQDGSLRVDAYAKSQIDNIPVKQSALEELAGTGDAARLKNMSFEVKAAYRNELDPIKKEAILKTAEYNALKKEMRGIYNTINNGKESTNIYKDLQKIESAIKLEQGSKKKGGAVHIQKHLDPSAKGAVTQQEVMSIGESVREYIKKYKEPFVDKDGGKIYEWQDKDGVRFRVAVYDKIKKSVGAGSTTRITTTDAYESIITFYSDRNLNGRMDFLDPRLRAETKFEEFKAKNLDENGNIKDGLSLC
jgi:superfamily II DNA and RNA helicase